MTKMQKVYIAGPMRGYDQFNFPAFDDAADFLRTCGYEVISPAEMDRELGFDETKNSLEGLDLDDARKRDLEAVMLVDMVAVLPGWRQSKGARAEVALAEWRGIPVIDANTTEPEHTVGILEEALVITKGDRQASYGPPDQDFVRTAAMWSALLGCPVSAKQVALCMIALKLSRETHQGKRDSWVDIAGYARCGAICEGYE